VRKALVTLYIVPTKLGPPASFTTDANGKFKFQKLTPGDYMLVVRHTAFDMVKVGIRPDGTRSEAITLAPGEAKTGLTVKLTPYGAIAGRVLDGDGDPVKGLRVSAMTWEYTSRGRKLMMRHSSVTDDQGDYRVYDVRPGKYLLLVAPEQTTTALSPDEESFAAAFYPNSPDARGAAPLVLSAGQQMRGVNFTLRRARFAAIRGRVIAPDGATDMTVELKVRSGEFWSGLTSGIRDPQGKFALYGIPPGSFNIAASYRSGSGRFAVQMPLEVGSNDIDGLELRPIPRMTLNWQVRIEGESQHKLSEASVELEGEGYYVDHSRVDDEGRLTIRGLEPEIYHVHASAPDLYLKSMQWGTKDIDGELDLTGGIPAKTELTIVFSANGGEVTGIVRNDKLEPVSAMVTLVPVSGARWWYQTARTEADGRFHIAAVAPGRYKLWAFDEVNPLAVMYDPDFLAPFASAAVDIDIQPMEKKSQDLKLTVNR
jgi:hypothetical protein